MGKQDGITVVKDLPVKIGDDARNVKAREAADMRVKVVKIQDEIDEYAKPRKAEIKDLEEKAEALEKAAATGEMIAQVECVETKDWQRGDVKLVRKDTGETVEGPRAMTAKERQTTIVDDPPPADDGAGGKKVRAKLPRASAH